MSVVSASKRDSITILADILRSFSDSKASRKMSIVYKANLNFIRIGKYLDILIATGMVEVTSASNNVSYTITDRGREFLATYEKLKTWLKAPQIADTTKALLA